MDQHSVTMPGLERLGERFRSDLLLRMESEGVLRLLSTLELGPMTCLDLGAANPFMSKMLRGGGNFWMSAVWSGEEQRLASALLGEEVLRIGGNGELPFEDKQFDLVVLASGRLSGDEEMDAALVHECHRILKPSGFLILNANYRKGGLSALLMRLVGRHNPHASYNEKQLFRLLRSGFDVLGIKSYCRFWMHLVSQWAEKSGCNSKVVDLLYRLAYQFDFLLIFTKGYRVQAHGRRKGWRERQGPMIFGGRSISDTVLRRSPR